MWLHRQPQVHSAPICTHGHAGCQLLSLADLFDRVIQHSARMHGLSNDLHSEFHGALFNRALMFCTDVSPRMPVFLYNFTQREELTEVILKLLLAWRDPLSQFHQSIAHHEDFNSFSSNKALEMSDMVHELKNGVEKVAEKMQLLGMISNSLGGLSSAEALLAGTSSGESHAMSDYELLHCFRRDSNKVQNYLKILKCRIVPEHGC
ncbi:hypothetical protein JZ751_016773 [Albula glossodonta]|uniref:Prolactin n=1 Tax=Albula glossodonta TaxID=121402 RepID=A0A8T2NT49_9TELE|nr:hypothetical protein JZ751_016773 [Albula glossodonta]